MYLYYYFFFGLITSYVPCLFTLYFILPNTLPLLYLSIKFFWVALIFAISASFLFKPLLSAVTRTFPTFFNPSPTFNCFSFLPPPNNAVKPPAVARVPIVFLPNGLAANPVNARPAYLPLGPNFESILDPVFTSPFAGPDFFAIF